MPKIQMLIVIYGIFIHAADNAPLPPFTCLPRTDEDPCLPDHELVTCTTNGTQDGCVPCPPGLRMCDATTSELPSKCYDPREACSADGDNRVQVTDLPGGGCTIRCICNESAGFSGDSHHCLPCPENQHNPHDDGLDKCVPRSTRPSTAVNPQQTLLVPSTTPVAASTTTTAASAGLDADNDNDNGDDMRSINSMKDTPNDIGTRWYIWIIVVLIAGIVIIVGIVVAVWCYCRQNGKTNAETRNWVCCVFGFVSTRNSAVFNQGLLADNNELQHLQESDTKTNASAEQGKRPDDPPERSVEPQEQPEEPQEQHVDRPEESEYPDEGTPSKQRATSLPTSDPPPYSLGQYMPGGTEPTRNFDPMTISESSHMPEMSYADGPDTTHRKMKPGLSKKSEFPVPTSQDGPCAMTAWTICARPFQLSSLGDRLATQPKKVVQGHIAEVSETERKIPVLGKGPVVSLRITEERAVVPQSHPQPQPQAQTQAQPEVQSQLQGQPQDSVVDSGSHIPGSRPSLGGESLHMSSFNSE